MKKGQARPNMAQVLETVSTGILHPELVVSGVYKSNKIPEVLASGIVWKPVFIR